MQENLKKHDEVVEDLKHEHESMSIVLDHKNVSSLNIFTTKI